MADVWRCRHSGPRLDAVVGIAAEINRAARGEGRLVLVAVLGGRVVGYGRARLWSSEEVVGYRNCPAGWWLSGGLVLPELRRQGIGRALMRQRLNRLATTVHSKVDVDNLASRGCHRVCGFVEQTRDFQSPGVRSPDTPMVLLQWRT